MIAASILLALFAQAQPESPAAIVERARSVHERDGARAALPEYQRALGLYRQAKDEAGEAVVLGYIGNCYKAAGDYERALEHHNRSLRMKERAGNQVEAGKSLSHIGLVYWEKGDYDRAIAALDRSLRIAAEAGDTKLEGAALNNLALVYDERGDYTRSLEHYERALRLHRANGFERGESATLGNIGGVYLLIGRYREAVEHYQQALAISERLGLQPSISKDLGNIGLCHLGLGDTDAALSAFGRALDVATKAGIPKDRADWLKGRGSTYLRLGRYSDARREYRAALAIYERSGMKRELVEGLLNLGDLSLSLGDAFTAERLYRRSWALARSMRHARGIVDGLLALGEVNRVRSQWSAAARRYEQARLRASKGEDLVREAAALNALAAVHRRTGRLADAEQNAARALEIASANGIASEHCRAALEAAETKSARRLHGEAVDSFEQAAALAANFSDVDAEWRAWFGSGLALERSGQLERAAANLERAARIVESVRGQIREGRYRSGYLEERGQVFIALARVQMKLGRPARAFAAAERLRAWNAVPLLAGALSPSARARLEALRERIRTLQSAVESENSRPGSERRSNAAQFFSAELVAAERAWQELMDQPAGGAPAKPRLLDSAAVSSRLAADTALIEYLVGTDGLTVFVLTRNGITTANSAVRERDLSARIELLRDLIVRPESDRWKEPAAALGRVLVQPVVGRLAGIRRLYVVPHAALNYVPFSVLPLGAGQDRIIDRFTVAYLPSASALPETARRQGSARSVLAAAPSRSRLQFAQREAETVASVFPASAVSLTGRTATEAAVKQSAASYSVLHFATHGHFNRQNPLLSALELEPSPGEDGRLEVHEIVGMRLHADLVTLSACDTALGTGYFSDVPSGDDFVGLTRAFLLAGADSVLASLWRIDDASTLGFMRTYYDRMRSESKSDALLAAQRTLRNSKLWAHPYYWSAFVMVGDMN